MTSFRIASAIASLFVLSLLAGCVTDATDHTHPGGDQGTLPMTGEEDVVVQVVMGDPDEFRFDPFLIEVRSGQRVGIELTNGGVIEHEFVIEEYGFALHLRSGQEGAAAFIAGQPGELEFGCFVPGHYESGMHGRLVVT